MPDAASPDDYALRLERELQGVPDLTPLTREEALAIARHLVADMAAEGQAILDEGIADTASDIDLVEIHGYGFPRWRGGPMFATGRRG